MSGVNHPSFKESLNTLRVHHAVVQVGQRIMLFVFTTLFLGDDLRDISGYTLRKLGSTEEYERIFNHAQRNQLRIGDCRSWDISLLFQLLQTVCELNPDVKIWGKLPRNSLEKLLHRLKSLRNYMAHNIKSIFTKQQRDQKLGEIRNLCHEILRKLEEKARISQKDIHEHRQLIDSIIDEVKKDINESSHGGNAIIAESQCDTVDVPQSGKFRPNYRSFKGEVAQCAYLGSSVTKESSIINQLISNFWKYAGPELVI
ncbi:unnamed protein product [Meganyctiphanes norvegica]|uniref:DZIP3-like HEPN domain-containing protein n=1 Tax=Meganyctiphanes norvegica TaxID=48144 RepID=A0AAV2Q499_MEGNR